MRREQGQATVELALLLPFLAAMVMVVVQVGAVVHDRVVLTHVAREAARAAVVDPRAATARAAAVRASGLDPSRLRVELRRAGDLAVITVRYRSPTDVPIVGAVIGDVELEERLVSRIEK